MQRSDRAQRALAQRKGRSAALADLECRLRGLSNTADDISMAARLQGVLVSRSI
jgi:hypothetical protein